MNAARYSTVPEPSNERRQKSIDACIFAAASVVPGQIYFIGGIYMKKTVAAYVTDRGANWLRISDVMKLDIVYYAFSTIRDGKPGLYGLRNIERMAGLKKINPNLKVVVSIGGWTAGGFSEAAMTPEGRALFTDCALAYVKEYDFDGIDMDWEYPCSSAAGIASSPEDKQNFTYLLESLRDALDQYGRERGCPMWLSAAVGAGRACVEGMEIEKVGQLLDHVNIMTYDMYGRAAGHHTGLYSNGTNMSGDKAIRQYADAGIPMEKMTIGAAFYARTWHGCGGYGQTGERMATMDFTEIDRFALPDGQRTTGYMRYWDATACAPYLHDGSHFISYDDEESIAAKCRYVTEQGLAGIMFWEYSCDRTFRLLDAMTDPANWAGQR